MINESSILLFIRIFEMYKLNIKQKLMCNFDISVSLKVRVVYGSCKFCWPKGEKFTLKHGTNFLITFQLKIINVDCRMCIRKKAMM